MNATTTLTTLSILASLSLAACASAPDGSAEKSANAQDALAYDTLVTRAADGTFDVRQVAITLDARHAQEAAREATATRANGEPSDGENVAITTDALTVDTGCGGASFWGYDGPNQTGNRICFVESSPLGATTALSNFCKTTAIVTCPPDGACHSICLTTWKDHIQSFWAGAKSGFIGGSGWGQHVSPYQRAAAAFPTAVETLQLQCDLNVNYTCPG